MNIQDSLTIELIKYICFIFGISNKNYYNNIGIIQDKFKTSSEIKIQYDDEINVRKIPVYSAATTFNGSKLHTVGCIFDSEYENYAVLFKLDELYLYALKLDSSNIDDSPIFLVSKVKKTWSKLSMYDKILTCAGLEKLNDAGIIWKPEPIGDFYNPLVEIVEM